MRDEPLHSKTSEAKPELFFFGAAALAVFLFLFEAGIFSPDEARPHASAAVVQASRGVPFPSLALEGEAAAVFDATSDTFIFEKNASERLPIASLAKIMAAVTALGAVPETTLVTIRDSFLVPEGDSGLIPGESWLLRELLRFMLIESSNDAAYAIASEVGMAGAGTADSAEGRRFFLERMNEKAREIGLLQTYFLNVTGLDISKTLAGGYTSARDAALLMAYAIESSPQIFGETRELSVSVSTNGNGERLAENTNKSVEQFPRLLGSKTGFTDLAGGNLVVAFDAGFNRPFIAVVLGATARGRFDDAEKLVWAALAYLADNQ